MGHRHAHDVLPLGVAGVAEQDVEVALLDRVARAEVVEERPVREGDHLRGGAAQDAAAQQEVAQDRGGVAPTRGVGGRGGRARSSSVSAMASTLSVRPARTRA
ncbi:hypothetical protein [Streptomyces sp. NBC_01445]|uniref:hypothetical protein n=1 Tax=Streptomyces sp. NBC_01445 TaxID=2903869 RepID=UPI002DDBBD40|nr:hypothetical protein [Streptomyces sp. NBC_01445]WSE05877.1 hypothetical protein OG574_22460 [Streptomyces sp. NBC_01445]